MELEGERVASMDFQRVIIVDLSSLGVGEASDAAKFNSVSADMLGHIANKVGGRFKLPTLTRLGLGNIRFGNPVVGISPVEAPLGFFGKVQVATNRNNLNSGLREMFDYQSAVRVTSAIDSLVYQGNGVNRSVVISTYDSYIFNQDLSTILPANNDVKAFKTLHQQVVTPSNGLIYMRLNGLQACCKQADIEGCAKSLRFVDQQLAQLINELYSTDLLLITSSFANDPTYSTTPTREYLPLIAYVPSNSEGHSLGVRKSLADVAATLVDIFNLDASAAFIGSSFLGELT